MDEKPTLSDLLALRDGEPVTAQLRRSAAQDEHAQARLARLQQIKSALQALPEVAPDEQTWTRIQADIARRQVTDERAAQVPKITESFSGSTAPARRRLRLRYPIATAAGVFCAAVLGSILWMPQLGDVGITIDDADPGPAAAMVAGTARLADPADVAAVDTMSALIDRSKRLEAVARLPVARAIDGQERSRQALLYRIADLDAQLNSLIEEEPMDPALKERLWEQRVALLETLVAVQQDQLRRSPSLH